MMPTLPVALPVALPPRPEVATPPDPAADAAGAGPSTFARALREAEVPDAADDSAKDAAAARTTRQGASRERTAPGRTRTGDTPDPAGASRAAATPARAEPIDSRQTDIQTAQTSRDTVVSATLIEAPGDDATATDVSLALPDPSTLPLPTLPPSCVTLDRSEHQDGGDAITALTDGPAQGRHSSGRAGGHALPGRHPLAAADAQIGTTAGGSRPTLPGEARAHVDARAADPVPPAAATATTPVATELMIAASVDNPTLASTTALPTAFGLATPQLDGLTARTVADPTRPMPEARLAAEPGSPAFTRALGEQMGVWVRDGVQEARIQLNPADLGPVQIQIALDGPLAQIDFHAAHARTREAIEASLPALASALRDAGFTLAGGGVFGQGGGDSPARTPPRASDPDVRQATGVDGQANDATGDDGLVAAASRSRGWRRGLLDVFA